MDRRKFVSSAGMGAVATAALAMPAIAQSMPEVKWRLTSSFPKSLDLLWGGAEMFAKLIGEMSDNKFQVRTFAAGEIVPPLQVADAVQNGTVEAGQTAAYYYFGKDPSFVFETGLPFSMNQRQYMAWLTSGGHDLIQEFYKPYGIVSFTFGGTGAQMGGWFRKEINSIDDLKGLKFRSGGFAGLILATLGVVPQQIAGGDIYPALEKGTIDATEWVGPYDDEKLGFQKVAKYYYYPGWWEGASWGSLYIGAKAWDALPPAYKRMVEAASATVSQWMVAKYDAGNPAALKRLVAGGTVLKAFPRSVLEASFDASWKYYDEVAAKNAGFKKILDSLAPFRADQNLWFRVAEFTFDSFNFSMSAKGR
jgi:TRAP-type mannitol/chloroaromatic compound transport system substrate-binding protein